MPRQPNKTRPKPQAENSVRIIGGKWRSRKIQFHTADGLRPTGDRIRETVFNWLTPYIEGANCVDLFAGSGALGFEALSRGAANCTFVEASALVVKQLRTQGDALDCEQAQFLHQSALDYLKQTNDDKAIDILFIDPPFAANMHNQVIEGISANLRVTQDTLIYIESPREWLPSASLEILKEKSAGSVCFRLLGLKNTAR